MPIRVTISPALETLPKRIEQGLAMARKDSSRAIVAAIKDRYAEDDAIASKATVKSVRQLMNTPGRVRVAATTVQAQFVEVGRRAGPVPPWRIFKPILRKWSRDKGLNFSDSVLWFIARKIRLKGYKARHSVRFAASSVAAKVARIFARAISQI
jgi:hypothetical protein